MKPRLISSLVTGVTILMLAPQLASAQPLRKESANGTPAGLPEPGYLGLITDDRQEAGKGVRVMEAVAGGPADKGGLQAGDLIVAINGKPVQRMEDFAAIASTTPGGGVLDFQVQRAGAEQKFSVTLSTRPKSDVRRFPEFGRIPEQTPVPDADATPSSPSSEPPRIATGRALLGVESVSVNGAVRTANQPSAGAVIKVVTPGGPAQKAGLKPGDVIVAIDARPIRDPEDLAQRVRQASVGKEIEVTYVAGGILGGQVLTKRIVLADAAILNSPSRPGLIHGEELPSGAAVPPSMTYPSIASPAQPPIPMPPAGPPQPSTSLPPTTPPQPAALPQSTIRPQPQPSGPPQPMLPLTPSPERPGSLKRPVEDPNRTEALKSRIRELEQRVAELERALKEKP